MRNIIKTITKINFGALLVMLPLACLAQEPSAEVSDRYFYNNGQEGYRLKLPLKLQVNFKKSRDRQIAVENRLPYDYVNFTSPQGSGGLEDFELGLGVHWRRDNQNTREFADKKDEGLKASGAQIIIDRQSEVTVANKKGVRDDFRMMQPDGWKSYSRVIIPYQDKFFVFLGTLGRDFPRAANEEIFQEIVDSFEITK